MITVMSIQPAEAEPWLKRKHYARRMCSISHAFGAYRGPELVGVVTYGKPASPNLCDGVCGAEWSANVIELNRLCCENSRNVASTLVGRSLELLPKPMVVVSYADTKQGHVGYVYQATNFVYTGKTDQERKTPRGDRIRAGEHGRHWAKTPDGKMDTSVEIVRRHPKHRYVFFCGDRRQKRQLRKHLQYPVLPYPKGETKRYDASAEIKTQMLLL